MNRRAKFASLVAATFLAVAVVGLFIFGRGLWYPVYLKVAGKRTVAEVVNSVGADARSRMAASFSAAGAAYPPGEVTLLALKDSAQLEVWVGPDTNPQFIRRYEIKALSGKLGPKLREGDRQVPEGIYKIVGLNPNSSYHLSMKLNYPNPFDLKHAEAEGRSQPGTNIFIHGKAVSIGCLAMGDRSIEELFVLAHDVGTNNIKVVIAPTDPRTTNLVAVGQPAWVDELYRVIEHEFLKHVPAET